MKMASLIFAFLFSYGAWAASSYSYSGSPHSISAAFGLMAPGANSMDGTGAGGQTVATSFVISGFMGIGADYDYQDNKDYGFGGLLRYYSASGNVGGQNVKNTMLVLGPDFKGYFATEFWTMYVGLGMDYLAPSVTVGPNSISINNGWGVSFAFGLMHQVSNTVSVGFETLRITGWNGPIQGTPVQDFMGKVRFQL